MHIRGTEVWDMCVCVMDVRCLCLNMSYIRLIGTICLAKPPDSHILYRNLFSENRKKAFSLRVNVMSVINLMEKTTGAFSHVAETPANVFRSRRYSGI